MWFFACARDTDAGIPVIGRGLHSRSAATQSSTVRSLLQASAAARSTGVSTRGFTLQVACLTCLLVCCGCLLRLPGCCCPQILCMHGGLSPELKSLEQIKRVARPTDVPDSGLLCDLLWADPDKDIQVRVRDFEVPGSW